MTDDRRLCTDCGRYRLGHCLSGPPAVWHNAVVPREIREHPVRCQAFRAPQSNVNVPRGNDRGNL